MREICWARLRSYPITAIEKLTTDFAIASGLGGSSCTDPSQNTHVLVSIMLVSIETICRFPVEFVGDGRSHRQS